MGIIYCHKNKITGKCYVGQTRNTLEGRIGTKPELSYQNNKSFSSDIIKFGWDNFESSILENVYDDSALNDRETYWISELKKKGVPLYNKYSTGTNNAKSTPLVSNRISSKDIEIVVKKFNEGLSIREIQQYVGLSILSIKKILLDLDYKIPDVGNLGSFTRFLKEEREKFMTSIKCPVCGKHYSSSHDMRRFTCCVDCQNKYSTFSQEQKNEVKKIVLRNHCLYKNFMTELNKKRRQHREHTDAKIKELKKCRVESIIDSINSRKRTQKQCGTNVHKVYIPKHTVEELQWRKDDIRCKQKLDLILNSGINLMKFGYNTKLCKMFPELTKGIILFLLRKYNIPHFERKGSKELS